MLLGFFRRKYILSCVFTADQVGHNMVTRIMIVFNPSPAGTKSDQSLPPV